MSDTPVIVELCPDLMMGCRKFEICSNDKVINCINRSSRHNWKQNSKLEDCSIMFVTVKKSKNRDNCRMIDCQNSDCC